MNCRVIPAGLESKTGRSPVVNFQQNSEDGLDAVTDNLHLARIHRKDNAHIS